MHDHLHRDFLAAVRGAVPQLALGQSTIPAEVTWQIYRRNYLAGHTAALEDTYSTVRLIVGEQFFRVLAKQFVKRVDSLSGDLNDYGQAFAAFLADSPSCATMPYLADIARLDWAWLDMLRSSTQAANWLAQLLALPPDAWPSARTRPASILIASPYPIYSIYRLATDGGNTVSLDLGGEAVLISRPAQVELTLLSEAEAAFTDSWLHGDTLALAMEAGLSINEQFDISAMLRKLATAGAFHTLENSS